MTILHLPTLQILLIQRISTIFHDIIQSSVSIRQKLFLNDDPRKADFEQIDYNPFLRRFGIPLFGIIYKTTLAKYSHPTASWRNMFVSMPSGKQLIMRRFAALTGCERCNVCRTSEDHSGIRMWQVADHVWEDAGELSDMIEMTICVP